MHTKIGVKYIKIIINTGPAVGKIFHKKLNIDGNGVPYLAPKGQNKSNIRGNAGRNFLLLRWGILDKELFMPIGMGY